MSRLLVHIVSGPQDPTRAALGLLVARTAVQLGHEVDVFFAGDATGMLRPETLEAAQGIGTGSANEHYGSLAASSGVRLFASGMSSRARGVTGQGLPGALEMALPTRLVELMFEADRIVTY